MEHGQFALLDLAITAGIFVALLVFLELGRRLGAKLLAERGTGVRAGVGVVDGTVYGLLGLLIGFAFSGAAGRFDKRSELVVNEVGAISTAWLRIDLMVPERQPAARAAFERYVDALLAAYQHPPGSAPERHERKRLARAEDDLWTASVEASLAPGGDPARIALLPALNEMFDAVDTERLAQRLHPPLVIYAMLVLTAFAAALFGGYALSNAPNRNWIHMVGVAATVSVALFVILELESPRLGVIRMDRIDQAIVELRETMR
jgi:hypothetical protein